MTLKVTDDVKTPSDNKKADVKTISLSKTSYTYNGKNQKPSVTVKDTKGKSLKKRTSLTEIKAKSKRFTAKWKKQSTQTRGYRLQYSTDKKFKKNVKNVTIKKKTTSQTVKKLKAKKKYYVRVRTYQTVKVNGKEKKLYSGWSKTKKVTVKK